jgi:hydroxyethylthiazole kinase
MAHAIDEVEEMVGIARALVLNIGTLDAAWVESMAKAGLAARRRGIPVVLDPVGAGATSYRTEVALRLLAEVRPTIVRGNASEIRALALAERGTRGVDSAHGAEEAVDAGRALAERHGCVVSISGAIDVIVDGQAVARVKNGVPMMARITGSGCTASALTGAFAAVNPFPFRAAVHAMAFFGIVGEIAAERAAGPGTLQAQIFDALAGVSREDIARRARIEGV